MRPSSAVGPSNSQALYYILLLPAVAALCLAVYFPLVAITKLALGPADPVALFATISHDPLYQNALSTTLVISAYVTLSTLAIGFVISIVAVHATWRVEALILILVVASWWMSVLLRSFAWTVLLQRGGAISNLLQILGIVPTGGSLLFTRPAVVIAMTHVLAPISVLISWLFLRQGAREQRQIAHSLGASDSFYFSRILLPRLVPAGLASGVLIFLLSVGFYITPELIGGGNGSTLMLGVLIGEQVNRFGNWQKAAVISVLLIGAVSLLLALLSLSTRGRLFQIRGNPE